MRSKKAGVQASLPILISLLVLLFAVVFLQQGGFPSLVGQFVQKTSGSAYQNEVWYVPCDARGVEDYHELVGRLGSGSGDVCGTAVSGNVLPGGNTVVLTGCGASGSYASANMWETQCRLTA